MQDSAATVFVVGHGTTLGYAELLILGFPVALIPALLLYRRLAAGKRTSLVRWWLGVSAVVVVPLLWQMLRPLGQVLQIYPLALTIGSPLFAMPLFTIGLSTYAVGRYARRAGESGTAVWAGTAAAVGYAIGALLGYCVLLLVVMFVLTRA